MWRFVWLLLVTGGFGCQHLVPPRGAVPPMVPLPAFAARGQIGEVAVAFPYGVGTRELGRRLAEELSAGRDPSLAAVVVVEAKPPRAVLAWAAVNWSQLRGPHALQVDNGILLVASCLRSVEPWVTPRISVSVDAEGRDVLASAAFTPLPDQQVQTVSRPLRTPSGIPEVYVHVTALPPQHIWVARKGHAIYLRDAKLATMTAGSRP